MSARRPDGRVFALLLVGLVLLAVELPAPGEGARAVASTPALLELLSADVYPAGPSDALLPEGARWRPAGSRPLHLGLLPLALALYALLLVPGRLAGVLRVLAAAAGIALVLDLDPRAPDALCLSLIGLAGAGALRLASRPTEERGGPGEMLFGAALVLVTAGLALVAIQAGAAGEDGLARWIPRASSLTRGELLDTGRDLQRALDGAAIAAALAMTWLLGLLKNRGPLGQLLVLLGAAFELLLLPAAHDALRAAV